MKIIKLVLCLVYIFMTACSSGSKDEDSVTEVSCENPSALPESLQQTVDAFIETYKPVGMSVLVSSPELGYVRHMFGHSDKENGVAVSGDTLWHSMSQGKSHTAAAILKLYEQGLLELDDKLSDYGVAIPDHPTQGAPTIRMAMTHTTLLERPFNTKLTDPSFIITTDPANDRAKHIADAVGLGYIGPSNCCTSGQTQSTFGNTFTMGSTVYYSSANQVALTFVIESITGKTWGQAVHDLVFEPWGLSNSFLLLHDFPENPTSYSTPHLRTKRYERYATDSNQPQVLFSEQFVEYATGGGTTYATVCDFEKFSDAFYKGTRLLTSSRAAQTTYVTLPTGIHYGLGTQGFPLLPEKQQIIGHFGGGPGGGGVVAYNPKNDAHIVVMMNYSFPDEVTDLLLDLLNDVDGL